MAEEEGTWLRIVAFLPVNDFQEQTAAAAVRGWLQRKFVGFTLSRSIDAVYEGYYRRSDTGEWDFDDITLAIIDVQLTDQDVWPLVVLLQEIIAREYSSRGRGQEAVLVTAHELSFVTL